MHPHVRFFVMGVAVGVAVGGLVTSVLVGSGSSSSAPKAAASGGAEEVQKLAQACVAEARRQCADSSHASRDRDRAHERARAAETAERELAEIEKEALDSGTWAKAPSYRARALVRRLGDDQRREFEGRVQRALDGGQLKLEEGAWKPGATTRPQAPERPAPRTP